MHSTNPKIKEAVVKYDDNGDAEKQSSIPKGKKIDNEIIGDAVAPAYKYFEITKNSPLSISSEAAYGSSSQNDAKSPLVLNSVSQKGNEYGLFAYQYEWYSILGLFTSGILNFAYSTTLRVPDDQRLLYMFLSIISVVVTCILFCMITIFRYSCHDHGHVCCINININTAYIRLVLYLINGVFVSLLPIGLTVVGISIIGAVIEFETKRRDISKIPDSIRNQYCKKIFCFCFCFRNFSIRKLIIFFTILSVSIASFFYGYVNGYKYACNITEAVSTEYYLNPLITGLMFGFGRIITINFVLLLLFSISSFCSYSNDIKVNNTNIIGKVCGMIYGNVEQRRFIHCIFGCFIVFSILCHCIFAYCCYQTSAFAHSFYQIYGWWILVTGSTCLLLTGVIIASANENIAYQLPKLFNISHTVTSIILIIILIVHGNKKQIIGQYFWMFIIVPFILYLCDVMYRYTKGTKK